VAWQKAVERRFRLWSNSKNCDITRTQNFYELQNLIYRSATESGDVFALLPMESVSGFPFETRIQIVEADRVSNPSWNSDTDTLVAGVEMDRNGAPIAYHITKQHPGATNFVKGATSWTRVPAFGQSTGRRNVLHLFLRLRPGQTRGVPYLAPVIEHLKMLGRFTEAELAATVVSSMFSVFVTSETGSGLEGLVGGTASTGGNADRALKLEPGLVAELNPGDKIETAQPGRPNGAFDPFVQAILRQIGVALEIPFEILVKHFTASYSASRAAVEMAWQFFKGRREWLASNFCQPVFEAWMDEQVASGAISAPGYFEDPIIRAAYLNAEWVGDAQMQIDPSKAADASEKRMRLGLSTLAEETIALSGKSWEENLAQRAQEKEAHEALKVPYLQSQNAPQMPQGQNPVDDPEDDDQDPNEEDE
jgi:lambda family phage portal protein